MSRDLVEIALSYAERGWPVLPLHTPSNKACSCGVLCKSPGKHPRIMGGVHSASKDPNIIVDWWQNWPRANIGIATGTKSNLLVIDIDDRHGGTESWQAFEKENRVQSNLIAKTGGGFHLFFATQGLNLRSRIAVMPGIDVRADGGFVVGPGSTHHSGISYSWITAENNHPMPIPKALLIFLKTKKHFQNFPRKNLCRKAREIFFSRALLVSCAAMDVDLP